MSKKRTYKLYMNFGTDISSIISNPIGQFQFVKNGSVISTTDAANYFFITGDNRYFKLDRSTLGIRSMGAYISSTKNYDVSSTEEFTLSFFVRIPRDTINACTYTNFPIDGLRWDGGGITLYSEASTTEKDLYKGRYIRIQCCGITQDIIYDYTEYDGDSYIHIALTLLENTLRIFVNGILYREASITNPTLSFDSMEAGNFTIKSENIGINPDIVPVVVFDELAICDRCLWTTSFIVPNRPLLDVFPEIIEEEVIPTANALNGKINSAPNYYSKNKSYWDADLDRAEIVRPDAYKAPIHWEANMYNKHKFNQDDYDYTAKSNWEYMYTHGKWPANRPKV